MVVESEKQPFQLPWLNKAVVLLTPQLLPYKPQVIRALAKPLDDKKRLVRKEAVSARGEW